MPWEFEFKAERGKWAAVRTTDDGSFEMVLRMRGESGITSGSVPLTGKDEITLWFSRNWYDVAGTSDIRHYRAGTNVKHLSSDKEVFC